MNTKDVRSLIDLVRDAESKELVIVSLFLLPILLGAWSIFLNSLDFFDQHDGWKFVIVCLLLLFYIVGLIHMKKGDTPEDKLKRARYHVEGRLKNRPGNRASFDAIRTEVNEDYSDDFLKKLIDKNPEIFGTCIISKGKKPGIKLVKVESEATQHAAPPDCAATGEPKRSDQEQ